MTLTEQWKKGELESSQQYYVEYVDGRTGKANLIETPDFYGFYNNCSLQDYVKEVLAPVPSYEEWQQLHKFLEEFNALDVAKENQQLKEKLEKAEATLLEIDGGWVTDEIRSKISEYFVYAIGEKK